MYLVSDIKLAAIKKYKSIKNMLLVRKARRYRRNAFGRDEEKRGRELIAALGAARLNVDKYKRNILCSRYIIEGVKGGLKLSEIINKFVELEFVQENTRFHELFEKNSKRLTSSETGEIDEREQEMANWRCIDIVKIMALTEYVKKNRDKKEMDNISECLNGLINEIKLKLDKRI